jgi:hypothetical protein
MGNDRNVEALADLLGEAARLGYQMEGDGPAMPSERRRLAAFLASRGALLASEITNRDAAHILYKTAAGQQVPDTIQSDGEWLRRSVARIARGEST